jgi:hypothetical protein
MWRQPRRPRWSSSIWMKSSATGSWCRSLVEGCPPRQIHREASRRPAGERCRALHSVRAFACACCGNITRAAMITQSTQVREDHFPHLALAAFRAISARCSAVSLSALALPPFRRPVDPDLRQPGPYLLPLASALAMSTTSLASWAGSRGRLRVVIPSRNLVNLSENFVAVHYAGPYDFLAHHLRQGRAPLELPHPCPLGAL